MSIYDNEVVNSKFSSIVEERLFPDNSFYASAQVDAGVGVDQVTVEIPQDEDGDAEYVVNPTIFPLQTVMEEDKKKSYEVDLIATKPQLITDLNQALVSYDKRAVKTRKHVNTLETQLANRIMYAWAPTKAEFITQTTGSAVRAAHATGATGNRKRVADDDILKIFSGFNDINIPVSGRRLVAPTYMYEDLMRLIKEQKNYQETKNLIVENGAIGMLYGFNIYMRPTTITYTEASTPVKKAIGATPATTDNQAILFFHPQFVRYAKGNVKSYINPDQGQYLGGTLNFALRGGGTISRLSEKGVWALVEDNE